MWWVGGAGGEKLGIKLKLSFSWSLGLAELGKNDVINIPFPVSLLSFIP